MKGKQIPKIDINSLLYALIIPPNDLLFKVVCYSHYSGYNSECNMDVWILPMLVIVLYTLYYLNNKRNYKDIDKLPGPPVKWFTGNATEFGSSGVDIMKASERIIKKYGRIVRLWFGPFGLKLFVTDPDFTELILSSNVHITKSNGYDTLRWWLGQGLINSGGEMWRSHRKILTPAFHFSILNQFSDTFHRNLQTLVETFKNADGKTIDVCTPIKLYSVDAICETSMGVTTNCQKNGENNYLKALHAFLDIFVRRFFSVLKNFDVLFKLSQDYQDLLKHSSTMHRITEEIIEKRRQEKRDKSSTTNDVGSKQKKVLMDILLDAPGLTDEEIRSEVDTFFFTGHDTVSITMSFALYELAKHQDVQKKILEEIEAIVGNDRSKEIDLNQLKAMSYLDRTTKEILRLYPVSPFIERKIMEDIEYKGIRIPAETTIALQIYMQHRDPELFPDPEKFDPDRFLPHNSRHPFAYIPFSAGPRNCIGQKYATMNVKTMVANIIRNFELRPADFPHEVILGNNAVLTPVNGLPLRLIYRK